MRSKKLIIVFTTNHPNTIGNECRLTLMQYLCAHFDTTIVTNQLGFIQDKFPTISSKEFNPSLKNVIVFKKVVFWYKLAKFLNNLSGDFVFLYHNEAPSAIWLNKPVFQYIHQYGRRFEPKGFYRKLKLDIFDALYDALSRRGFSHSIINFAISPFLIGYFQSHGVRNMSYSPHGVELAKFQNPLILGFHDSLIQKREQGKFIIGYTGWISENRGFELLLQGIKELSRKDSKYVLVICGADIHFTKRIEEFKEKNQLQDQIVNYGIVDSKLIPGILAQVDLCTSFWDRNIPGYNLAPPQKIFEYFAAGKPVICSDIPTHSLYVTTNLTGALINNTVEQFVDVVSKFANDPMLMNQMKANCLTEAIKFDSAEVYQKVCDEIDSCI